MRGNEAALAAASLRTDRGSPGQIHTVSATSLVLEVAMPTGYRAPRELRWLFFDLVCSGTSVWEAERQLGVSRNVGAAWWRKAGAMKVQIGGRGRRGLLQPGNMSLPGGRGHRLSVEERVEIMRARDAGLSDAEIAERLDRDRSTIYRETRRNRNADGDYHALMAHARAAEKARRPKNFKLIDNPLCAAIEAWMDQGWSPKLIADVLARDHRDDKLATVSHETIYQCLYVQTRGSLRADLHRCLSTKRSARKSRGHVDSRSGSTAAVRSSPSPSGRRSRRPGGSRALGR
ncbi:hypothetical protein MSAS_49070 [Mycobacterium saskatchewanense]|nr:hypothetical protein MSAS_49070 [Mycobacterium saskatchewanense]